jgi:cation-transporting ATPase 13A3/4/5
MLPEHKSNLISFLQSYNNNIVAMCGDGANDCRAFMTSDIGIAINQSTTSTLISHFYTSKDSITCVITIISNGRACFENKIISIKFMILYSIIQITSVLFLNIESQSMNDHQYLFTDLFFILIPMIIAVSTMASKSIAKIKPPKIIVDCYFIYSVLGQIALQVVSHVMYGMFIRKSTLHPVLDVKPRNDLNVLSTYMYVFALFQYLNVLFIFNSNSIYRKQFHTNKLYLVYYGCCVMVSVCFIAVKEMPRIMGRVKLVMFEDDSINFEYRLEINKAITILWIFIWFIVCILYENVLFKKWVLRCNKSIENNNSNSNNNNPVHAIKSN